MEKICKKISIKEIHSKQKNNCGIANKIFYKRQNQIRTFNIKFKHKKNSKIKRMVNSCKKRKNEMSKIFMENSFVFDYENQSIKLKCRCLSFT
jgi:hypothetical protein